jgi:hypothetical protein
MGGVGKAIEKAAKKTWKYGVKKPFDVLIKEPASQFNEHVIGAGLDVVKDTVSDMFAPDINMPGEEPPAPMPDLDDATSRANEAQRRKRRLGQSAGRASTLLGSKQTGMASKTLLGE